MINLNHANAPTVSQSQYRVALTELPKCFWRAESALHAQPRCLRHRHASQVFWANYHTSRRQKTTFVASISHELRSPLHGILGTLEFIKDTELDAFQVSMINSLHSCGQTLLDTINQVMDYAKSNEAGKTVSSRKLKNSNTIRLSSKPLKTRKIKQVCCLQ